MVLQAIIYSHEKLEILDQTKLPHQEVYIRVKDPNDAWQAIQLMQVRGAPAIAIVASLSLAVFLSIYGEDQMIAGGETSQQCAEFISKSLKFLVTSRPTAVNLADAARKLERIAYKAQRQPSSTFQDVCHAYIQAAEKMLENDVKDNEKIGKFGAEWICRGLHTGIQPAKLSVLTHCNTGSLATAGYGTALGVIRALNGQSKLLRAYYTETRPYNQGSRLTGYELIHDKIPSTLITDSMAASLLKLSKEPENIACVIVGADRVAANGDTANKIGTYSLAILARYHGVKFLVAAPRTTIDLDTPSGDDIKIEERPPTEITLLKGPVILRNKQANATVDVSNVQEISISPIGTQAWNPAFDVTPAELIDGVVTEMGVVEKSAEGVFDFHEIFKNDDKAINGDDDYLRDAIEDQDESPLGNFEGKIGWRVALRLKPTQVPEWKQWMREDFVPQTG